MTLNTNDLGAGLIFIAIGGLFAADALNLNLGTAFRMGPGYFPLVLAGLLIAFGLAIVAGGFRHAEAALPPAGESRRAVPWRGLVLILTAPIVFGLTVRGLGLVPAIVLVVLLSSFASRRMTLPLALALTAGLTIFCVLVFSYGLGLSVHLFGSWLAF